MLSETYEEWLESYHGGSGNFTVEVGFYENDEAYAQGKLIGLDECFVVRDSYGNEVQFSAAMAPKIAQFITKALEEREVKGTSRSSTTLE